MNVPHSLRLSRNVTFETGEVEMMRHQHRGQVKVTPGRVFYYACEQPSAAH